jgi:hypothetical protein
LHSADRYSCSGSPNLEIGLFLPRFSLSYSSVILFSTGKGLVNNPISIDIKGDICSFRRKSKRKKTQRSAYR